jgi:hypothetical protein
MKVPSVLTLTLAVGLLAPAGWSAQQRPAEEKEQTKTFAGMLVDADCKARDPAKPCEVSGGTTSFGLVTADGWAKFDPQGNSLAANYAKGKEGPIKVKVTGKLAGDTIQVEQLDPDR